MAKQNELNTKGRAKYTWIIWPLKWKQLLKLVNPSKRPWASKTSRSKRSRVVAIMNFLKKDACRIQNRLVSIKAQCVILKGSWTWPSWYWTVTCKHGHHQKEKPSRKKYCFGYNVIVISFCHCVLTQLEAADSDSHFQMNWYIVFLFFFSKREKDCPLYCTCHSAVSASVLKNFNILKQQASNVSVVSFQPFLNHNEINECIVQVSDTSYINQVLVQLWFYLYPASCECINSNQRHQTMPKVFSFSLRHNQSKLCPLYNVTRFGASLVRNAMRVHKRPCSTQGKAMRRI